jgi:transcriptional regulator GlxA family with amidase domain
LGARALFGMPAGELARTLVGHDELASGLGADVLDEISEADSWRERFAVLDRELLARVAARRHDPRHDVRPEVAEAWRELEAHEGKVPIGDLADRLGWSARHLSGRFSEEYGLPPKQAARLFRFRRARRLAATGLSWAETAFMSGYADQAHLAKDWRDLAGQTPTESRETFRILQDGETGHAPDSAA